MLGSAFEDISRYGGGHLRTGCSSYARTPAPLQDRARGSSCTHLTPCPPFLPPSRSEEEADRRLILRLRERTSHLDSQLRALKLAGAAGEKGIKIKPSNLSQLTREQQGESDKYVGEFRGPTALGKYMGERGDGMLLSPGGHSETIRAYRSPVFSSLSTSSPGAVAPTSPAHSACAPPGPSQCPELWTNRSPTLVCPQTSPR